MFSLPPPEEFEMDSQQASVEQRRTKKNSNDQIHSLTSGFRERFNRYCQWTSLHGFNFFGYPERSSTRTIFWMVIILVSATLGLVVVGTNIRDFSSSTVSYDLDTPTLSLDDVLFPGLVLCNMNQMRSSFVWALVNDPALGNRTFIEIHQLLEKIFVKGQDEETTQEEEDLIDLILSTKTYNDMFEELLVVAGGDTVNDTVSNMEIFHYHHLMMTDITDENREKIKRDSLLNLATQFRYGEMVSRFNFAGFGAILDVSFTSDVSDNCLWVTPLVLEPPAIEFRDVLPFARNGINNGLKFLLDAEVYDYASPIDSKSGFLFTVLHHLDIAILKQTGSVAMPGQALQVAITPVMTSSADSIKYRFDPVGRQCYFEEEIEFKYLPAFGFRYSMTNCLYEASLQKIARDCKCIPPIVEVNAEEGHEVLPSCQGPGKLCMSGIMNDIGAERYITMNNESKICLAPCHDQNHQFLVTSSAYPNKQSFHLGDDFCLILNKLRVSCNNERRVTLNMEYGDLCLNIDLTRDITCDQIRGLNSVLEVDESTLDTLRKKVATYASENLVTLDIYIGDPYVKQYMRREKITIISFIGNVGGLLGLFMGFSFISIVEVLYIFCFGSTRSDSGGGERWATPTNSGTTTVPTRKGRNFLQFLNDSGYARKNTVGDGCDAQG